MTITTVEQPGIGYDPRKPGILGEGVVVVEGGELV